MSLKNKFGLKLPFLNPKTEQEHARNLSYMTQWANDIPLNERIRCFAYNTVDQAITTATTTFVAFNTVLDPSTNLVLDGKSNQDPYGFFNPTQSTVALSCPSGLGGVYLASGLAQWQFGAITTSPLIGIVKNNTCLKRFYSGTGTAWTEPTLEISHPVVLKPGDSVKLVVFHASGANRTLEGNAGTATSLDSLYPFLEIVRIAT